MEAGSLAKGGAVAGGPLHEAVDLPWRKRFDRTKLGRRERFWTVWTVCVVAPFIAAGGVLVWLEPWTFPVAIWSWAHAWAIPMLYGRRAGRSVVPIGSAKSAAASPGVDARANSRALGLLGDLLGHRERQLMSETGFALQRGGLGVWLLGEKGALLVRPGGRRVDSWCVRIAEPGGLPAGDRVAHLLLALREDEDGFCTVANMDFSGAAWRVRRHLPERARPALDAARAEAH
ncbi:MAG: hypothetical protein ACR2OC_07020 [Solirubrobacterales bacterium]